MPWKPDYITSAELKAFLRIEDTEDDPEVAQWVTSASRAVDRNTGRQFGRTDTATTRTYRAVWSKYDGAWLATIDDLQVDPDGLVVVDAAGDPVTDFTLLPRNAADEGKPYEVIQLPAAGLYDLTEVWGWAAVPAAVKMATKTQANRFAARRDSPYGIAGSPQEGSEMRLLAKVDPDVAVMLTDYRRRWWAA